MFTVVKVRARPEARGDYKDPGWYKHPPGTVAFEWTGALAGAGALRRRRRAVDAAARQRRRTDVEVQVRKPSGPRQAIDCSHERTAEP